MALNPENLAAKIVVFKVLKTAKNVNNWDVIDTWLDNIDPESLSLKPMTDSSGREGWSDRSLWYNYQINNFIKRKNSNEAINLVDKILPNFPKQRKFFMRLKAQAYDIDNNLIEAENIYQELCSRGKPDWWLLYEYAKVIQKKGHKEKALNLMYQSAYSSQRLDPMVALFADIGALCKDLSRNEEAAAHFVLCKYIRDKNSWSIPELISKNITELDKITHTRFASLREALEVCRKSWKGPLVLSDSSVQSSENTRKVKRKILGKVNLGEESCPFCFIYSENNESYFCYKSDLPSDINNGEQVIFDAIPSFDKKKNKESWKASNIQYYSE